MADAFGAAVGALTIVIGSVKAVLGLSSGLKEAPDEINAVIKDVHAFSSTLSAIAEVLNDDDVGTLVRSDETMTTVITMLKNALDICGFTLSELRLKIQNLSKPRRTRLHTAIIGIKWSLATRREIQSLRTRLEVAKSTLNQAWQALIA